ncbi:hypothetical protein KC901_00815 [Patescibacteria group bacterium]|nr:hypothetical protein [Patescibacteria group bacterium]
MIKKKIITLLLCMLFPSFALAQFKAGEGAVSFFESVSVFVNRNLIPVLILLALTYVVYSGVSFIMTSASSTGEREQKKRQIFWGIIGLFVIVSVWGLVAVVGRSFGLFAGGTLR